MFVEAARISVVERRLLFVEDDDSIRELTAAGLERAGFSVHSVADGEEALTAFRRGHYEAVVLDIMLPGADGLEVCRQIRVESGVPIIMLTARGDTVDVVVGLEAGADDYVRKPFEMAELVARLRAALRRVEAPADHHRLSLGDLVIDAAAHRVTRGEEEVSLTATEFKILHQLASRPGQVFTREMLLDMVWGYDYLGDSRLVDVAIQRLRAKIEETPSSPRLIQTVRGVGYRAAQ